MLSRKKGSPASLQAAPFTFNINRWHLPTLPPLTAVPSAARGLTALFEMEEVNTRLTSTNLIELFILNTPQCNRVNLFSNDAFVFFPAERDLDNNDYLRNLCTPQPSNQFSKQVSGHASGLISTARLYCSHSLHLPPIHVVVSNGPLYRNTHLGAGFALRCFQRLS